jgi:hypothetical protein
MTDAERALLEHRSVVRVNLPSDANHAARTARWLAGQAGYARMPGALVERLEQAAEILEAEAFSIAGRVQAEGEERERLDLTTAAYQRRLERSQQTSPDPTLDGPRSPAGGRLMRRSVAVERRVTSGQRAAVSFGWPCR